MHLPKWFKIKISSVKPTKNTLKKHSLFSVCEEARCPNQGFCFSIPTVTFLILGDTCTRRCSFCSIKSGIPQEVDKSEPLRILNAVKEMGLRYVVITSVTRDDLNDGGASHFADTIRTLKEGLQNIKIEVLTPDFQGNIKALRLVLDECPDVFNHNIETVKRLYPIIRPQADYERSLMILQDAAENYPEIKIKSGLMLGFGETFDEVIETMNDLRKNGCNLLTIGQYLMPAKNKFPVVRYIKPEEFEWLKKIAISLGFDYVASGPIVRSSMNAEDAYNLS